MNLLLKRAKIFMLQGPNQGSLRWTGGPGTHSNVPNWVTQTGTYQNGVADGSIVDITPAPVVAKPAPKPPESEPEQEEVAVAEVEQPKPSTRRPPAGKVAAA